MTAGYARRVRCYSGRRKGPTRRTSGRAAARTRASPTTRASSLLSALQRERDVSMVSVGETSATAYVQVYMQRGTTETKYPPHWKPTLLTSHESVQYHRFRTGKPDLLCGSCDLQALSACRMPAHRTDSCTPVRWVPPPVLL